MNINQTTTTRIHPLIAAAAVSVILVSLVGMAAITGVLPNSHGAATTVGIPSPVLSTAADSRSDLLAATAPLQNTYVRSEPALEHAAPVVQAKPVVHRRAVTYVRPAVYELPAGRNSSQQTRYAPQAASQNSPLGIGVGALIGGLAGNQVGGGNGRTLATIAGVIGGGYLGNEMAKRSW